MPDNSSRIESLLEEFLLLYKFVNKNMIAEKLLEELSSSQLIEIYEKTDGEHSTREIAGSIKERCSHGKVALLWNKWARSGIVIPAKQKGRYKAAFDLAEFGINNNTDESEE
jgi:hypothetical protein